MTPLEKRALYTEDWIGLKTLGENNLIEYVKLPGTHMQISDEELEFISKAYLGALQEESTTAEKVLSNIQPGDSELQTFL